MSAPLRTVLIPAGGQAVRAVLCDGRDDLPTIRVGAERVELGFRRRACGQHLTRPGVCPHCGRRITRAEFEAAIRAAATRAEESAA